MDACNLDKVISFPSCDLGFWGAYAAIHTQILLRLSPDLMLVSSCIRKDSALWAHYRKSGQPKIKQYVNPFHMLIPYTFSTKNSLFSYNGVATIKYSKQKTFEWSLNMALFAKWDESGLKT